MTDIINGNNLIEKFMDLRDALLDSQGFIYAWRTKGKFSNEPNSTINYSELQYHTSWDWIMPVVEKIQKVIIPKKWLNSGWDLQVYFSVHNFGAGFLIGDNNLHISDSGINSNGWNNGNKTMLENTYSAVIQFIEWYNTQNQTL